MQGHQEQDNVDDHDLEREKERRRKLVWDIVRIGLVDPGRIDAEPILSIIWAWEARAGRSLRAPSQ